MADRRVNDPRLHDRQRISDPRLDAVKPMPPDRYATNRTRQPDRSHERSSSRVSERRGSNYDNYGGEDAVPPRYSPPPSLKPYTIPRRAGQKPLLKPTSLESREGTFVIDAIKNSLWNPETVLFEFTGLEMVNNDRLEAEYITKRKELKEAGRTTSEISDCFVFSHMRSKDECRDICQRGIYCKSQTHLPSKAACSLGDKNFGAYLCRCADAITKKIPTLQYGKESMMLICKVMKGRVKTINDFADQTNPDLEPTPDFDSHISRRFQRGKKMTHDQVYDSSQIYLYEINLDNISAEDDTAIFAKRPRQCLPYAVVYFKVKQNIQPIVEPKLPLKDSTTIGQGVVPNVSQVNPDQGLTEAPYDDCLKNLRYFWNGFCFMKNRLVSPIKIGVFSKKDVYFPLQTPNITIQQKISWEKLSRILPGKIYRKPPCRLLQPETEVVGIKFIHSEIHATDQRSEEVLKTLHESWLNSNMAGVCSLSSGYKLYILPSSAFTDKLGLSDPSYSPILHCLFMKETSESLSMKGSNYEKFILRQQLSLHSRLCENDDLKDVNIDINGCVQRKYAYSVNERQLIAKYLSLIRRSQEKRGITKAPADPSKKLHPQSQHHLSVNTSPFPNANPNRAPPLGVPIIGIPVNPLIQNVMVQNCNPAMSNNLLTTVSTPVGGNPPGPLISPSSSDSNSPTEHGADDKAIDFCLSFKREGSEKTERVKLFPTEANSDQIIDSAIVPLPDHIEHIPPPLFTQQSPPPLYGEPVPQPLYSEPAPPTPPPAIYCESPPPPPPLPQLPSVNKIETIYAPTPASLPSHDAKEMTVVETDSLKKDVMSGHMSDDSSQDSEDNLVINLDGDEETENEYGNTEHGKEAVDKSETINSNRINIQSDEEDSESTPTYSIPAKLKADDVFLKSSQNLLSQLSSVLPKSLSKDLPKNYIVESLLKKTFSSSRETLYTESPPQTSTSHLDTAVSYAVDSDIRKEVIDGDNYDNVTMDESSESSQDPIDIPTDLNTVEMEYEESPFKEKKSVKCSSPSLTQLNFTKEKILHQLSILKAQTEEKRIKNADKKADVKKAVIAGEYEFDSGAESQESEVIPFLGVGDDDEENDIDNENENENEEEKLSKESKTDVTAPISSTTISPSARGTLDIEKAELALLNIGTNYYDQLSPSGMESKSIVTVTPLPSQDKSPPQQLPQERPIGKVLPVSTSAAVIISTQSPICSSSLVSSATRIVSVGNTSTTPVSSDDVSSLAVLKSQIPFLSGDPSDRVPVTLDAATSIDELSKRLSAVDQLIVGSSSADRLSSSEHQTLAQQTSTARFTAVEHQRFPGESFHTRDQVSLTRAPLPLVSESSNLPKRPIMEVSPVVRSTPGPWLNTVNRPTLSMNSRTVNTPPFRPVDRQHNTRPTIDPAYRNINTNTYPVKGTYGVNREQADAMYLNRETSGEKNTSGPTLDSRGMSRLSREITSTKKSYRDGGCHVPPWKFKRTWWKQKWQTKKDNWSKYHYVAPSVRDLRSKITLKKHSQNVETENNSFKSNPIPVANSKYQSNIPSDFWLRTTDVSNLSSVPSDFWLGESNSSNLSDIPSCNARKDVLNNKLNTTSRDILDNVESNDQPSKTQIEEEDKLDVNSLKRSYPFQPVENCVTNSTPIGKSPTLDMDNFFPNLTFKKRLALFSLYSFLELSD